MDNLQEQITVHDENIAENTRRLGEMEDVTKELQEKLTVIDQMAITIEEHSATLVE